MKKPAICLGGTVQNLEVKIETETRRLPNQLMVVMAMGVRNHQTAV
jgi:hypothetical protein